MNTRPCCTFLPCGFILIAAGSTLSIACGAPNLDEGAQLDPAIGIASKAETSRMVEHLRTLQDMQAVRHSFDLPSGDSIDCMDIQMQPALRRPEMRGHVLLQPPAVLPQPDSVARSARDSPAAAQEALLTGGQDGWGRQRICPSGTVPIRRVTQAEMTRFRSLEDFFRKVPSGLGAAGAVTTGSDSKTSAPGPPR